MTYYINVNDSNLIDFINIIKSLKNIGVINSYESIGSVGAKGDPLSTDALLSILDLSKKEIDLGKSYSSDEIKKIVTSWKQK